MPNLQMTIGRLTEAVENTEKQLSVVAKKMDDVLNFQAKTEERLTAGNKKFEEQDKRIKNVEDTAVVVEMKSRGLPRAGKVYALIVGGFTVLAFLVSIIALKAW